MADLIMITTNKRIDDRLAVLHEKKHLFESNKNPWLKNTDVLEIRALLGLIYFRGLYNLIITALIICFQRNNVKTKNEILIILYYF